MRTIFSRVKLNGRQILILFALVPVPAVLGLGAHYVETGAMEIGPLAANSQYISMVLMSVMMLALVIMMFLTAYACSGRIVEVLETETCIQDGV